MKRARTKLRLGIIGCGAIGSRIAQSTKHELKTQFMVSALYDIDIEKTSRLASGLKARSLIKKSVDDVIRSSDVVVECVNTPGTRDIVRRALRSKKDVLVMSVGRLLGEGSLFSLAEKNGAELLFPSGAIAGLDAVKAARIAGITSAVLTTTKPPRGFEGNAYVASLGLDLQKLRQERTLFEGKVQEAVARFPQNINVAAALALAVGNLSLVKVRIVADPDTRTNAHDIRVEGAFGRLHVKVENKACPDNPKTSYLAVLSAIQTLKQYASSVKIGS